MRRNLRHYASSALFVSLVFAMLSLAGVNSRLLSKVSAAADEAAAGIIEVNSTADSDDGLCAALGTGNGCTLREAMNLANNQAGVDRRWPSDHHALHRTAQPFQ